MRGVWTVMSVVCFLNLMALLAAVGWLANSGRLDQRRLLEVRELLLETTAQRDERERSDADEVERLQAQQRADEVAQNPPMGAEERLAVRLMRSQADEERLRRLRREVEDLQASISRQRRLLDQERAKLLADETAFLTQRERIVELEGDDQFRKALVVFETLKAGEAKEAMDALLASGKRDEVVAYLNAMEDRARSKVIAEFIKAADAPLAAQLLEDLRVRGIGDLAAGDPPP